MGKTILGALFGTLAVTNQLLAQAATGAKGTTPEESKFKSIMSGLFSDWLIWALLIGLFVLIGVFFWVRNRSSDD